MPFWQKRLFQISVFFTTLSGFAFLIMKYFLTPLNEFAVINHPWQAATLKIHIVSGAVLVFSFGLIVSSHALPYLRSGMKRALRSGWTNIVLLSLSALSGILIQVIMSPGLIQPMAFSHIGLSFLFTGFITYHMLRYGREKRGQMAALALLLVLSLLSFWR